MAREDVDVRVLQEITLQVIAPVVPEPIRGVDPIEIEQGALTMARGALEGTVSAVAKTFPAGYGLRFKPAESIGLEVDTVELSPDEVREALGEGITASDVEAADPIIYTDASGEPFDPQPVREGLEGEDDG